MRSLSRKHYIAYASICLIWGSTWGAIRLLVRDVPPLRAAAVRFGLAATLLLAVIVLRRLWSRPDARQWRALIVLGFTMMGIPYGLVFWAEYRISSSMTAVLFSSLPLFVALMTPLITGAVVPRRAVFSMLIALGAIAILFYTGLSVSPDLLLGGAAVIISVLSSAWAAVYAKREISAVNPLLSTAVQFAVSAAVLFIGSLLWERNRPSDWNQTSVLALLFLAIVGSAIAFSVYYWLLSQLQAYQVSTTNLVIPIVAIAEGALLLQERVPLLMMAAATVILVAVGVVLRAEDEPRAGLGIDIPAEH